MKLRLFPIKVLLLAALLFGASPLLAQVYSADGASETGGPQSVPGVAFLGDNVEQINTANLNIHLSIPLATIRTRGGSFTFKMEYNSFGLFYYSDYGIGMHEPFILCVEKGGNAGEYTGDDTGNYSENVFVGCDGSAVLMQGDAHFLSSNDGTYLTEPRGSYSVTYPDGSHSYDQLLYTDRNGNLLGDTGQVEWGYDLNGYYQPQTITYYDENGNQQQIVFEYSLVYFGQPNAPHRVDQSYLLSKITLPNGKSYQFHYVQNLNGGTMPLLTWLDLPLGGHIQYSYPSGFEPMLSCYDSVERTVYDAHSYPLGTYLYEKVSGMCGDSTQPRVRKVTYPTGDTETYEYDPSSDNLTHLTVKNANGQTIKEVQNSYEGRPGTVSGGGGRLISSAVSVDGHLQYTRQLSYIQSTIRADDVRQEKIVAADSTVLKQVDSTYYWETHPEYLAVSWDSSGAEHLGAHLEALKASEIVTGAGGNQQKTIYAYDEYGSYPLETYGGQVDNYPRGNLTSVTQYADTNTGYASHTWYDLFGNVVRQDDAKGHHTYYSYVDDYIDAASSPCGGNDGTYAFPTSVTDNAGRQTKMKYYRCSGLIASLQDPNDVEANRATTYHYDGMNQLTDIWQPAYWGADQAHTHIDYDVPTPEYDGDEDGDFAFPGTFAVQTTVTASPDPAIITKNIYDALGRPLGTTIPDGNGGWTWVTRQYYDSVSRPYYVIGGGTTTTTQYDALSRVVKETAGDGSVRWTCYGGLATAGQPNCRSYVGGVPQDGAGRYVSTWVDQTDWTAGSSAPQNWQRASDGLGRLVNVVEPPVPGGASPVTRYAYDALGNLTTVLQAGGLGPPAEALSLHRDLTYNGLSQLLTAYNPESGWTCYGTTSPANSPAAATNCQPSYDANGNLLAKTDARGETIAYSYSDPLDRLVSKTYSGPAVSVAPVSYQYDDTPLWGNVQTNALGRLSSTITNEPGGLVHATLYNYDALGRQTMTPGLLPSENGGGSHTYTLGYNLAGAVHDITYPSGRHIVQSHDERGRINKVTFADWFGTPVNYDYMSSATYTDWNALSEMHLGNGVVQQYGYNDRAQLDNSTATLPGTGAPSFYRQYSYAPYNVACSGVSANNGNIWSITDSAITTSGTSVVRTKSYNYDCLNRITAGIGTKMGSPSIPLFDETYSTDSFGNMIPHDNLHGNPSYSIDQSTNRLQIASSTGYDAAGNLTQNATQTFSYDPENRLALVNGGATATYQYDADGNRIRKDANGQWTEYLYVGGQVLAEKSSADSGAWVDYIYANGKRIARADSYDRRIHVYGNNPSIGAWTVFSTAVPTQTRLIAAGDKLVYRQYNGTNSCGGVDLTFSGGGRLGQVVPDQNGVMSLLDTAPPGWHTRIISLDQFAGQSIVATSYNDEACAGPGNWEMYFGEVAVYGEDGTVWPIYNRDSSAVLSIWGANTNGAYEVNFSPGAADAELPQYNTTYYLGDHLDSTGMELSAGGWPTAAQDYTPYGKSVGTPIADHYKFTGKERDDETADASGNGLDYYGARYYASSLGRFMSPDPLSGERIDPQSLNKYSYVRNNPLRRVDPTGMYDCVDHQSASADDDDGGAAEGDAIDEGQCDSDFDRDFERDRQAAMRMAGSLSGAEHDAAMRGLMAYGTPNDGNGVTIAEDATLPVGKGLTDYTANRVSFNAESFKGDSGPEIISHEGVHLADLAQYHRSGRNPNVSEGEMDAYHVQYSIHQQNPRYFNIRVDGFRFDSSAIGYVNVTFPGTYTMVGVSADVPGEPWSDFAPQFRDVVRNNLDYSRDWNSPTFAGVPR